MSESNKESTASKASPSNAPVKAPSPGVDNQQKNPSDWVTGGEAMTGAQASFLKTLCEAAGEPFDASLSKADASRKIDALKKASSTSAAS